MTGIWKAGKYELEMGKKTYIMGILNVTPDSFSDGGVWMDKEKAVGHALEMQAQGADVIDIGGQSTRPGHVPITEEEELARVLPIVELLAQTLVIPVSVDTYYPAVAQKVMRAGASIINDVSGIIAPDMAQVVAETGSGWIVMHTGAEFTTDSSAVAEQLKELMHSREMEPCREYPDGIAGDVRDFFEKSYLCATSLGVLPEQLCFDTGIGFGKSYIQNLDLLRDTRIARLASRPLLVGASRKRFIGEAAKEADPLKRLAGTIAANTAAVAGGADVLRVHDVEENVQAAQVADAIYRR